MKYFVCYDVSDDRCRARLASVLENYGHRIQYSIFECRLSPARYSLLVEELRRSGFLQGDMAVTIIPVCESCGEKVRRHGHDRFLDAPNIAFV